MDSLWDILIFTNLKMEGTGLKNFIEQNKPGVNVSLYPFPSDFTESEIKCIGINSNSIFVLDADSCNREILFYLVQKSIENGLRCVFYSQLTEPGLILKAKDYFVSGYVSKLSSPECLIDCINVIELGGTYYDATFSESIKKITLFQENLSTTQRKIFHEVLTDRNKSIKELAENLKFSKHTLEVHLSNIYQKAGVNSFQELISLFSL